MDDFLSRGSATESSCRLRVPVMKEMAAAA
jgi:hypothetical protein